MKKLQQSILTGTELVEQIFFLLLAMTGYALHASFLVLDFAWASYETRRHMERCIKALCNADIIGGLKIGRDVSLPKTYVRSARNPLRDLGGKPPSQREILAFYAGAWLFTSNSARALEGQRP
ncbi:unnamed protein product [Prunus armeniaca]|uniref:Uncharacterized protein n=1 Tax=Prunus armeniaca TaxID=36596 RepID=A0A6J5VPR8_PRUAR|nr:unnamed protein product [Prunus armeniaca]CAB4321275.1 unnamed protein product [Prunus armeniaca]